MITPNLSMPVLKTSVNQFYELKRRFKMIKNEEKKAMKIDDVVGFRKDFEELSKIIPNWKGKLIAIGYNGSDSCVIDMVSSEGSLRIKFKEGFVKRNDEMILRYDWYKFLLFNNVYSKISIQMIS